MAIALATVIATVIKLPSLPNGGSVTLISMLIICLVGYWYGPVTGIIAAVAYGVLQFITGPYVVHPLQVLLDYPLAFGALGLSGFFYKKKNGLVIGYIVGVCGRFVMHMISGLIFLHRVCRRCPWKPGSNLGFHCIQYELYCAGDGADSDSAGNPCSKKSNGSNQTDGDRITHRI